MVHYFSGSCNDFSQHHIITIDLTSWTRIAEDEEVLKAALKSQLFMYPWSKCTYEFKFLDSDLQIDFTIADSWDPQTWNAIKDLSCTVLLGMLCSLRVPWGKENMKSSEKNHKDKDWKAGSKRRKGESGGMHIRDLSMSLQPSRWAVPQSRLAVGSQYQWPKEEKASSVSWRSIFNWNSLQAFVFKRKYSKMLACWWVAEDSKLFSHYNNDAHGGQDNRFSSKNA